MQIRFEHNPDRFQTLAEEWDLLVPRSRTRSPFLLHSFQSAWWATRGGGEWPSAELWLGLGRESGDGLAAVAPLFYTPQRRALMLLGSIEIADTLDFIGSPTVMSSFVPALVSAVDQVGPSGWETLDIYNVPETSPTISLLEAAARERGWRVERERLQPAPYLELGSSWEAYLEQIDSKQRRELKRKLRRADVYPMSVTWRMYESGQDLSNWVNILLDLMAYDLQKRAFLTEPMRQHFHLLAEAAAREGWLQIALLDVGGEPAFGYFNFDFNDILWIYNSGFNPQHAALSPGWVLMGHLIRWGIEHGRKGVDFLRGAETYKYRLGGIDRYIERVSLIR
jgi:CelD/BcsL family acetyltransferase involved in cellulose biosynthesis